MRHEAIVVPAAADETGAPPFWRYAVAIALAGMLASLAWHWHQITALAWPDMDDRLRLVEVRDWLAGQGFYDVSQHRMNQPGAAPMHWSRLVDMPLAAVMLALRPLLGAARAEIVAAVLVPLMTLGAMLLACGAVARRLAGRAAALTAIALAGFTVAATAQAQPLRVDHHGWEIVFALVATTGLLARDARRGAIVAGVTIAVALQISLEALPYAAALGGIAAFIWWRDGDARSAARLACYAVMLFMVEAALFALLRAPADLGGHCDAVSPPHLFALAVAASGCALATRVATTRLARAIALLGIAVLAALGFRVLPPHCGADAFSALEPIVRIYWYRQVAEGQPVWHQGAVTIVTTLGFPVIALICTGIAGRRASDRAAWTHYGLLLLAATAIGAGVLRASAFANALAVPAVAWGMTALVTRIQRSSSAPIRVFGSVAAVVALSPFAPAIVAAALPVAAAPPVPPLAAASDCTSTAAIRRLNALPTGRIFAPFDIGPAILLDTGHAVLASAHHRNHAAMADELRVWLGGESRAHAILRRHGIGYVLSCPTLPEVGLYRDVSPRGFAARLAAGRVPAWLMPVPLAGTPFRVWRVAG